MTLTQIAERFEKFLSNDIEGLGHEERDELLDCCHALKVYSNKIQQLLDILRTINDNNKRSELPNCS